MKQLYTGTVKALLLAAVISSSVQAQGWQTLPFTYDPAGLLASGTRRVFASPHNNTVITAYAQNASPTNSYISMDGGLTWNQVLTGKPIEAALFLPNGHMLLAAERKYMTTSTYVPDSLYRSSDGITWANLGPYSNSGSDKGDYAVTADNKVLFPRSSGLSGPYFDVSADNGSTWTGTGYLTNGINSVAVSYTGDTIIVGNTDGVRYSHDGGATWGNATGGSWGSSENGGALVLPNGDVFVAGPGRIYKSTDGGQTFTDLSPSPWMAMTGISHFHYHAASGRFFIKNGPYGIFESTDCITWTDITGSLGAGGITDVAYSQNYIYVSKSDSDTLYRYEITGTAGAAELTASDNLQVWPNPASDLVHIGHIPPRSMVNITDVNGRTVYSAPANGNQTSISTAGFVNGIYLLKIESSGTTLSRKLVVSR